MSTEILVEQEASKGQSIPVARLGRLAVKFLPRSKSPKERAALRQAAGVVPTDESRQLSALIGNETISTGYNPDTGEPVITAPNGIALSGSQQELAMTRHDTAVRNGQK